MGGCAQSPRKSEGEYNKGRCKSQGVGLQPLTSGDKRQCAGEGIWAWNGGAKWRRGYSGGGGFQRRSLGQTKLPAHPPQMSWEEVVGGGKRKREGGRGQVSNPEPERGDTQMLADGMQRMAECKLHLTV